MAHGEGADHEGQEKGRYCYAVSGRRYVGVSVYVDDSDFAGGKRV